ncbi:MAG: serine hydrolase domain-containing protein, partial [Acetobacteraceae bacterium]
MDIGVGRTRADLIAPFSDAVRQAITAGEVGLQVAVYQGDDLVVDVWAGIADPGSGAPVRADTLFPTFSVIKAVTAVALHIQAARGLVDYDAPIARYWPEFAANGKDGMTVRHVLHHRSGLWQMPPDVTPERMADYDWMCGRLAGMAPMFTPGTRNGYQSYTFGWLIAEVVRRTDPKGRHFRDFVRQEILDPLGIDDLWMGVPPPEQERIARLIDAAPRPLPPDAPRFKAIPLHVGTSEEIFGRSDVRAACIPGAGGFATARAMARFFAMLANGGMLAGVRVLPQDLVSTFTRRRPDSDQVDDVQGIPVQIGAGFWLSGNTQPENLGCLIGRNPNAFGHPGAGCSIGWADPDRRIAVAILHNRMMLPPATAQDPIRAA